MQFLRALQMHQREDSFFGAITVVLKCSERDRTERERGRGDKEKREREREREKEREPYEAEENLQT